MWYWEVLYKDKDDKKAILRSSRGFPTRIECFISYLESSNQVSELLRKLKAKLILQEILIFDNENVFG